MKDAFYRVVVAILLAAFRICRIDIRGVDDERFPAEGGAVIAMTHFGYIEFALAGRVVWGRRRRLVRFLATDASFRHPVSGPLMRAMHHVPVDRKAGAGAYAAAVERLRAGELIGVFPEGQVNRAWVVGRIKSGAVRMAAEAGVPVIPVAVWGGHRIMTRGRKVRLRDRLGVPVRVHVGEPMWPQLSDTETDTVAATSELRRQLQALVDAAQSSYPEKPVGDPWWLPASMGGSAPSPDEAAELDSADAAERLAS